MRARLSRFLLLLPFAAAASRAPAELVDRVAASINGVAIPESAVRRAMVLSPLERQEGESAAAYRARVLDALIDQSLEYEDALRFGPPPPDASEIEGALARLRARLAEEGKDPTTEFRKAGMTDDDVRASVERQLVVQRYLRERFRPSAVGEDERARAEYAERYAPERRAAGLPVPAFDEVAEDMRARVRQRSYDEEVEKWLRDLRDRARIRIYPTPSAPVGQGTPVVLATAPPAARTPSPAN